MRMIPRSVPTWQEKNWQHELSKLITEPRELLQRLQLPLTLLPAAESAASHFPLRVTESFLSRMRCGDVDDPLLRQVLPLGCELSSDSNYGPDPLREQDYNPAPGLIHKYRGRVLLVAAPQCAINCRYCFRREFDYKANTPGRRDWQQALDYLARETEINEVILSGGDPLILPDRQLNWLIEKIERLPHINTLRIHSRLPIVLPSRLNPEFFSVLEKTRLHVVLVVHCNHPQELDQDVHAAFIQSRAAGLTVLNQAVLLRGVNDCSDTLAELSHEIFRFGVLPYYLHLLDPVSGAAHFDVPEAEARHLHQALRERLPGYLLPRLVREIPGEKSKTQIV